MSRGAVFLFTGFSGQIMGIKPLRIMEHVQLRGYNSHGFLDTGETLFLDGGDGFDGLDAMSAYIAREKSATGVNIGIAASSGGYMALRQAIAHGFDLVLGLGAVTSFAAASFAHDDRLAPVRDRLFALEPDDARRDAGAFLEGSGYAGRILLVHGEGFAADAWQARNIARFPQVALRAVNSARHDFIQDIGYRRRQIWDLAMEHLGLKDQADAPRPDASARRRRR